MRLQLPGLLSQVPQGYQQSLEFQGGEAWRLLSTNMLSVHLGECTGFFPGVILMNSALAQELLPNFFSAEGLAGICAGFGWTLEHLLCSSRDSGSGGGCVATQLTTAWGGSQGRP